MVQLIERRADGDLPIVLLGFDVSLSPRRRRKTVKRSRELESTSRKRDREEGRKAQNNMATSPKRRAKRIPILSHEA